MLKQFALIALIFCSCKTMPQKSAQTKGDKGDRGESVYDIWLKAGHKGSEADFLSWLKDDVSKTTTKTNAGEAPVVTERLTSDGKKLSQIIGYTSIADLGCTGSNDCAKILTAYINSRPVSSIINLFIPEGVWYFQSTLLITDRKVNIKGADRNLSIIYVSPGIDGIFIDRRTGIFFDYTLENFAINALGKTKRAHGIKMWQRGILRNLDIQGFSGNGVYIDGYAVGSAKDDAAHNAAFSKVYDCIIGQNGENGVYIDGQDGSACIVEGCDIRNNGMWGIWDSSFLGCSFISNMMHANKGGAYHVEHPTAITSIIGGYSEGDQPPSLIWRHNEVIGKAGHYNGFKYYGDKN